MKTGGGDPPVRWVHAWPDGERPHFRIGRRGSDLVAEWPGFATLSTDRSGNRCEYQVDEETVNPSIAAKFYAGRVRGLLRHLQGELTCHGAAVTLGGTGVLFLGPSGAGKSSLVAALCAHHAAEFVADDATAILLDPPRIARLETHHWLVPDSPAERERCWKLPAAPLRLAERPSPLGGVVILEFDQRSTAARLEPLRGRTVFETLNSSAIRFIVDEPVVALHDFHQIATLAREVPVFRLIRPRGRVLQDAALVVQQVRGWRPGSAG
jgi:hypothetical protein